MWGRAGVGQSILQVVSLGQCRCCSKLYRSESLDLQAEAAARFTSLQQCFRMASRQEMCFVTANAILQISGTEGLDGTVRSPLSSTED